MVAILVGQNREGGEVFCTTRGGIRTLRGAKVWLRYKLRWLGRDFEPDSFLVYHRDESILSWFGDEIDTSVAQS